MCKALLFEIIQTLNDASYTVIACVLDCGGGNMGLWKELRITFENTHFQNPVTDEPVYVFADVPHLLKLKKLASRYRIFITKWSYCK